VGSPLHECRRPLDPLLALKEKLIALFNCKPEFSVFLVDSFPGHIRAMIYTEAVSVDSRHGSLHLSGGSATSLSATSAWIRSAPGDAKPYHGDKTGVCMLDTNGTIYF